MADQRADLGSNAERAAATGTLACARCGASFPPRRDDKRFCSDRCRAAASRARQAAKVGQMEALIADLAAMAKSAS